MGKACYPSLQAQHFSEVIYRRTSLLFLAPLDVCWGVLHLSCYLFWFPSLFACFRKAWAFWFFQGGGGRSMLEAHQGCIPFLPGELLHCVVELAKLPACSCWRAVAFSMEIVGRWMLPHHKNLQMTTLELNNSKARTNDLQYSCSLSTSLSQCCSSLVLSPLQLLRKFPHLPLPEERIIYFGHFASRSEVKLLAWKQLILDSGALLSS